MSRNIHISTRKRIQQNLVAAFVCILVKSSGNTEVCEWAHRVPFCACVCMCLVPLGLWVGVLAHVFSQLTGVNDTCQVQPPALLIISTHPCGPDCDIAADSTGTLCYQPGELRVPFLGLS